MLVKSQCGIDTNLIAFYLGLLEKYYLNITLHSEPNPIRRFNKNVST